MDERTPLWTGESRFADGHPSQMMNDICGAFMDATQDSLCVLDNLAVVDLNLANEEWRLGLAESLRRDAEHVAKLYANAIQIATTLKFEEETA